MSLISGDEFSEESASISEANWVLFLPFQLFAAEKNAAAVSKWLPVIVKNHGDQREVSWYTLGLKSNGSVHI